jgi:signal transduction histidine kinase
MSATEPGDFKLFFESAVGLNLVLYPDLTIAAVSDAYLKATMTKREEILGKGLFEVFPDNPGDLHGIGASNLRNSFDYVLKNKKNHRIPVQKYDIKKPDGSFAERYWNAVNKPILNKNNEVIYIIHRVDDVTELVNLKKAHDKNLKEAENLSVYVEEEEIEAFKRLKDFEETQKQLLKEIAIRKAAEEKAKETHTLLLSSIESLDAVLIFSVDKNYKMLIFNTAFKNAIQLAYGIEVKIGMNLFDLITSDEDKQKAKRNLNIAMTGTSHVTIEEYGVKEINYFETRSSPIFNDEREIIGITVLSTNITERRNADDQIKALNQELEAFTYSVAHDLRAPLRIIDGYSSLLMDEHRKELTEEATRLLKNISKNANQMGNLIDDLLEFSKLGRLPVNKKSVNVTQLLNSIVEEQMHLVDSNRVTIKLGKIHNLKCDPVLIKNVFSNYISNAIKYSQTKDKSTVEVGSTKNSEETIYFVKDNGVGFDMKYANKLFGVFQRLHSMADFEGTGIGQAIPPLKVFQNPPSNPISIGSSW